METDDPRLMAYVDGELDASGRAAVEAGMARDPQLARWVSAQLALRQRLQGALRIDTAQAVPQRLLDAAWQGPAGSADIVDLPQRKKAPPQATGARWPVWTALAASLVVGAMLGILVFGSPGASLLAGGDGLVAGGALREALNQQNSGAVGRDEIRIGLSFRDRTAQYCRTFLLPAPQASAGLACRGGGEWTVLNLMPAEASVEAGGLRMAASPWPAALLNAVESRAAGQTLDAAAEARAIAGKWRR